MARRSSVTHRTIKSVSHPSCLSRIILFMLLPSVVNLLNNIPRTYVFENSLALGPSHTFHRYWSLEDLYRGIWPTTVHLRDLCGWVRMYSQCCRHNLFVYSLKKHHFARVWIGSKGSCRDALSLVESLSETDTSLEPLLSPCPEQQCIPTAWQNVVAYILNSDVRCRDPSDNRVEVFGGRLHSFRHVPTWPVEEERGAYRLDHRCDSLHHGRSF